jgi:hypothetical protein
MPENSGGAHTHGRHGYRLGSPEEVHTHLQSPHGVTASEPTEENWDALATAHRIRHEMEAEEDGEELASAAGRPA